MPSIFDDKIYREFVGRIEALTPASARQWGKMSVHEMICHLTDALRNTLGETPASFTPNFLSTKLGHFLILNMPTPKGKVPTLPQFKETKPGEWTQDLSTLKSYLGRVFERGKAANSAWGVHPKFGHMTREEWGKLTVVHFDHHLRQFGV